MNRKVVLACCILVLFIGVSAVFLLNLWEDTPSNNGNQSNKSAISSQGSAKPVVSVSSQSSDPSIVKKAEQKELKTLTKEEMLQDFNYMYSILKENYPFFEVNKRLNNVDWLANKDKYIHKISINSISDKYFFEALQSILEELNNDHTHILDEYSYIYMRMLYEDLAKVDASYSPWCEVLQNKKAQDRYQIEQISMESVDKANNNFITPENVRTDKVIKNKVAYLGIKSLNSFNMDGDNKIITPFLKEIKDYKALIIDIRGNVGGNSSYWADNIVPLLIKKDLSYKYYSLYRGGNYTEPFLISKTGAKYDKLNPIENLLRENLDTYVPEIRSDFRCYYESIMTVKSRNYVGFKGKIYLLVDRGVFSSSEKFAAFSKDSGFATLVGETTGGDGIGSDPLLCVLPNSGYILRFPSIMGLNSKGYCNEEYKTQPDVKISVARNENLFNDECVKYVLSQVK
jgi:hypothetical protein